jgi:hypothetical protein
MTCFIVLYQGQRYLQKHVWTSHRVNKPVNAEVMFFVFSFTCVQNPNDSDKADKDKAPSPFEASKKDVENGNSSQPNGIVQNGLVDEDKAFK